MATWLALDLSLSSTGWALFASGMEAPAYGHWELAAGMKWRARGYVRLHKNLMELHREHVIDSIDFEEPLNQAALKGNSSIDTITTLTGLAAHAESFAEAIGAKFNAVNISSWRRHFIGSMPRGTKTPDLKWLANKRCRELGFDPAVNDESDAIGILDYRLSLDGIIAPWRQGVLQRELNPQERKITA